VTKVLEGLVSLDQSNWSASEAPRQDRWQLRESAGMYAGGGALVTFQEGI
jgi:hypothetical protein